MSESAGRSSMPFSGHTSAQTVAEMAVLGKMLHEHRPALLAMLERRIDPKLATRHERRRSVERSIPGSPPEMGLVQGSIGTIPYVWLYRICLDTIIAAWRRESRQLRDVRRDLPCLNNRRSACALA